MDSMCYGCHGRIPEGEPFAARQTGVFCRRCLPVGALADPSPRFSDEPGVGTCWQCHTVVTHGDPHWRHGCQLLCAACKGSEAVSVSVPSQLAESLYAYVTGCKFPMGREVARLLEDDGRYGERHGHQQAANDFTVMKLATDSPAYVSTCLKDHPDRLYAIFGRLIAFLYGVVKLDAPKLVNAAPPPAGQPIQFDSEGKIKFREFL